MPIRLPERPNAAPEVDWLALGALSIGSAAALIATIGYISGGDPVGAAFTLVGGAGLMGLLLFGLAKPPAGDPRARR